MKEKSDHQVSLETAYKNAADLLRKKEFKLAEQQLSEILKKFPDDPNALRLSGVSSLDQQKPEAALIPLQKAIRVAPQFLQAHENLAQTWTQLGDLKKAQESWTQALELDPSNDNLKLFLKRITPPEALENGEETKKNIDISDEYQLLKIIPENDQI